MYHKIFGHKIKLERKNVENVHVLHMFGSTKVERECVHETEMERKSERALPQNQIEIKCTFSYCIFGLACIVNNHRVLHIN